MPTIKEDLRPGTAKAQKITKLIRDSIDLSWNAISQNYKDWDTVEEHYRAFRPTDDDDRESIRKHNVTKVIVPIQFATIQIMLTFLMEVFTALKPVLRTRGADPASVRPARVMELGLDYDYRGNRGYLQLHQWFLNAHRYGYGIIENSWGRRVVLKRMLRPGPGAQFNLEGKVFDAPGALEFAKDYFTLFEGNTWQVVDNRQWFPDPRVPITRFQDGQFCGKRVMIHDNDLRKFEDDGIFFNTSIIETTAKHMGGGTREADLGTLSHSRDKITPDQFFASELRWAKKNKTHINEQIIIELIPKDFELSDEDRPEQWIFNLIDGTTIVRSEPNPFYGFNYSIVEPYPDILAFLSHGVMELMGPLAGHLTFLFNSHMANVRKAVNDMLVVDPSRVNLTDLLDPRAGKLIRLMPLAYGQDPNQFIRQLQITDITQGHNADAKAILDLWNTILGTSPHMFGQIAPSRRTASELQGVMRSAGSRMKMTADLFSAEGVAPLTEQMAVMRQENMSSEQFFEIAGYTAKQLGVTEDQVMDGFIRASRSHLTGVYTFPAEEGVLPQDRVQAAQILMKVFETVAKAPFLARVFDPVEIFRETVRQSGLHNIDDFLQKGLRGNVSIMNDEVVGEALERGKLRPIGRPDEGVREGEEGLSLEGAIHGAGRTRDGRTTTS